MQSRATEKEEKKRGVGDSFFKKCYLLVTSGRFVRGPPRLFTVTSRLCRRRVSKRKLHDAKGDIMRFKTLRLIVLKDWGVEAECAESTRIHLQKKCLAAAENLLS